MLTSIPVVAVLGSPFDNRFTQVKVGQIFERLCLVAALVGVRYLPRATATRNRRKNGRRAYH
jgi:hypothetical protein